MSPITNRGAVNQVFAVTTGSGKYILRIDPEEASTDDSRKKPGA